MTQKKSKWLLWIAVLVLMAGAAYVATHSEILRGLAGEMWPD